MNVAILHYHLNQGGVTRVVANHLRSLEAAGWRGRVLLVTGPRREAWPADLGEELGGVELESVVVPEFDYDEGTTFDPGPLERGLREALSSHGFSPDETVLHVHNHSLGKNLAAPLVLRRLADDGFGLVLHVHDFAEDFRPANYARMAAAYDEAADREAADVLYLDGPRVHYAVLNRRDFDVLGGAGVPPERLHFLPNPAPTMAVEDVDRDEVRAKLADRLGVTAEQPYLLYPVRGIQRKNVGEVVLWSALLGDRAAVGITLAPINPVERGPYDEWVDFARNAGIPMRFGVGESGGLAFEENMVAADRVLVTSIAEGFGLSFLEPWTFGRSLVGRNLPEITADFAAEGLRLDGLYDTLPVPLAWVGRDEFEREFREAVGRLGEAYHRAPAEHDVTRAIDVLTDGDVVDFGTLGADLQRAVVRRVAEDAATRSDLLGLNPAFEAALEPPRAVEENRRVVERRFSLAACGQRLGGIYESVLAAASGPTGALPNAGAVLDAFLDLTRLRLLRS